MAVTPSPPVKIESCQKQEKPKCPNYLLAVVQLSTKGCDQKINVSGRNKAGFIASPSISLWTLFKVSHLANCGPPLLSELQYTHVTLCPKLSQTRGPETEICFDPSGATLGCGIGGMLALRCAGCKKQVGPSSQSIIPLRPKKLAMPNMPPNKRPPMPAPAGSPDTLGLQGTACQIDQFAATSPLPPGHKTVKMAPLCVLICYSNPNNHCKWMVPSII